MSAFQVFDSAAALDLNRARMEHLASLDLLLDNRYVLDVGCGVGHLAQFFLDRGCKVRCMDARIENLIELRKRKPGAEMLHEEISRVGWAEVPLAATHAPQPGPFQIVFCYGLLYHVENPVAALRNMAAVCTELMLIETIVTDALAPLVQFVPEDRLNVNQSVGTFGCRTSSAFVVQILQSMGFTVYGATPLPDHPDFLWSRQHNLQWQRDGNLLRQIFVASRETLHNPKLIAYP